MTMLDGGEWDDLDGRVALVTGASGGFGTVFAEALAERGALVVLTGRRLDVLKDTAARTGGKVVVADLLDFDADILIDQAEDCFDRPVSLLINNAGIGHGGKAVDLDRYVWRAVMGVDLFAPFYLTQAVARRMIDHGIKGSVVNIASIFGKRPAKGMIAYATAKAALIQMTRCFALELNGAVRVNALAPGWHVTPMTEDYLLSERGQTILRDIPSGRFGAPDDLVSAMLLLATCKYMNGTVLTVDGGLSAAMRDGGTQKKAPAPDVEAGAAGI